MRCPWALSRAGQLSQPLPDCTVDATRYLYCPRFSVYIVLYHAEHLQCMLLPRLIWSCEVHGW